MTILVLSGGLSDEREVSLRSALAVKAGLIQNRHVIVEYDPAVGLDKLERFVGKVDLVFPVLHGLHGEDGEVQQVLEKLGLPYIGADADVSRLCFNKDQFNQAVSDLGYTIPQSQIVNLEQFKQSPLAQKPFVLKPNTGGSSIDTLIAKDPVANRAPAEKLLRKYSQMLLQELIEGTEITVAVLDGNPLPVIEIIPPAGEEFDYENKYNGKTQELCPPVSINQQLQSKAQQIAADINQQLGVRHFSRTDMMVDASGNMYVLELNTIPGLTATSLFPKAAQAAGIDMAQLVEKLVQMAATA